MAVYRTQDLIVTSFFVAAAGFLIFSYGLVSAGDVESYLRFKFTPISEEIYLTSVSWI